MLLTTVRDEFVFHCQYRKLSPKTIGNYTKQIDYLLRFLQQEKKTVHIEDVRPNDIKEFLLTMSKTGRTSNYVNDLLKALYLSRFYLCVRAVRRNQNLIQKKNLGARSIQQLWQNVTFLTLM